MARGKKPTQPEQVLQVLLFRKDEVEPTVILESDFTSCKKVWKTLVDRWKTAHKEAEPFILEDPIVTAIEPGMVAEIKIFPKMEPQVNVDPSNPYQRQMMQHGLSQTIRNTGPTGLYDTGYGGGFSELQDGGYK